MDTGSEEGTTMLILSRRPNESLVIGSEVTLTVLGIKGNQVRLGIDAPRDVVVDRAEVRRRKVREANLTVATLLPDSLTTTE
jgi:carbon storage regulator